jgi:hypothetical protein
VGITFCLSIERLNLGSGTKWRAAQSKNKSKNPPPNQNSGLQQSTGDAWVLYSYDGCIALN